jgi:hypothetical protein
MGIRPPDVRTIIEVFRPLFSERVWPHVQLLLVGALLTVGRRTVTGVLRTMGLSGERRFKTYHRVLSRARWSGLATSRVLLDLLVKTFVPTGPLVMGLDDTIERRWGPKIATRGIYRDPVRSSRGHMIKVSGLRWLSLMLLTPIPWAGRVWALPFLTLLCPSERYYAAYGRTHRLLTERARQMLRTVQRWLPARHIVVVADRGFAALALLAAVTNHTLSVVTRLRLDAALYEPVPPTACERSRAAPQKGPALADAGAGPGRSKHPLAPFNRLALVRGGQPHRRDRLGHGHLVSQRDAARGPALGVDPRSDRSLQDPGVTLYPPPGHTNGHHPVVRATLADGGHF